MGGHNGPQPAGRAGRALKRDETARPGPEVAIDSHRRAARDVAPQLQQPGCQPAGEEQAPAPPRRVDPQSKAASRGGEFPRAGWSPAESETRATSTGVPPSTERASTRIARCPSRSLHATDPPLNTGASWPELAASASTAGDAATRQPTRHPPAPTAASASPSAHARTATRLRHPRGPASRTGDNVRPRRTAPPSCGRLHAGASPNAAARHGTNHDQPDLADSRRPGTPRRKAQPRSYIPGQTRTVIEDRQREATGCTRSSRTPGSSWTASPQTSSARVAAGRAKPRSRQSSATSTVCPSG